VHWDVLALSNCVRGNCNDRTLGGGFTRMDSEKIEKGEERHYIGSNSTHCLYMSLIGSGKMWVKMGGSDKTNFQKSEEGGGRSQSVVQGCKNYFHQVDTTTGRRKIWFGKICKGEETGDVTKEKSWTVCLCNPL